VKTLPTTSAVDLPSPCVQSISTVIWHKFDCHLVENGQISQLPAWICVRCPTFKPWTKQM